MADADDYESLPDGAPFKFVALAGAAAGIAEHCIMYPIDSVKTRKQALTCEKSANGSIISIMKEMIVEEGKSRPIRGVSAMMLGAGPAHAMYFGVLEKGKTMTQKYKIDPKVGDGASAIVATCFHDAIMTPADVVKQRMQMCCSPYERVWSCATDTYKSEGLKAFYRSYPTALQMNIPYQTAMVMTYGAVQRHLNPNKEYKPIIHFLAGAIAGTVASVLTNPWDVCKTLLNTQEKGVLHELKTTEIRGIRNAVKSIWKISGFTGFYKGLWARILYQAPATAISWSVYEFMKYLFITNPHGSEKQNEMYDTLSVMSQNSGQNGPRKSHLTSSGSGITGNPASEVQSRHSFTVVTASS